MKIEKQSDKFYSYVWVLSTDTNIIGRYLSEQEAIRIKNIIENDQYPNFKITREVK